MFGRRKREQEEAAREAERRAMFAELAKRPDTICPFLGMAGTRTGYQESVSDEHRCYAFGDPAELSAEQQTKVCLQPGYGNCPRYLRGVLVIPTEELEALRHPQPMPPPTAAVAAKAEPEGRGLGRLLLGVLGVLVLAGAVAGGGYWYLSNQVPSSAATGTLPTGTDIGAELLSLSEPEGGSQRVRGVASIGPAVAEVPQTTFVYVIDLSASTLDGIGCGGDQNRDGLTNTPLDCEIAAAVALNQQAIDNGTVTAVGVVGFAGGAATADVSPAEGTQVLIAPDVDDDGDSTPNAVEALQSAFSGERRDPVGFRVFAPVDTRTRTTSFSAGITAACDVMSETDTPNRLVVFLSDGANNGGDPVDSVLPCETDAVFQTFAVGADASCQEANELGTLQDIAELSGGLCTPVVDISKLPAIVQSVVEPQIVRIQLTVDGGEPIDISQASSPRPPEAGPAELDVDYPIVALTPGEHQLCMTVFASDAGGAGEVQSCSTVDAGGGRLSSD